MALTNNALPKSFYEKGFVEPARLRPAGKFRRLLIGCDGPADSGKTEFSLSAPGPGMAIALDRGIEAVFDNQAPPPTRQPRWGFKVINPPVVQSSATRDDFLAYWGTFKAATYSACDTPECRSILIDGDSDSWELQRLAEFGKLQQVPSILYTAVNAARRAFYARLWDSGKIIIATNKIKKLYTDKLDAAGNKIVGTDGKSVREWDGVSYERQGFDDQEYLWQIQLRHMYDPSKGWGILIQKCKANKGIEGQEFWGEECNFQTLVSVAYPQVPLAEWGY